MKKFHRMRILTLNIKSSTADKEIWISISRFHWENVSTTVTLRVVITSIVSNVRIIVEAKSSFVLIILDLRSIQKLYFSSFHRRILTVPKMKVYFIFSSYTLANFTQNFISTSGGHLLDEQDGLSPHEFYQLKIEDINEIVQTVRKHLTKARQIQVQSRIDNMKLLFVFH